MDAVDRLAVGLIRSLNSRDARDGGDDRELLSRFGDSARPLAEALHAVIREEVARCSTEQEVATSGR